MNRRTYKINFELYDMESEDYVLKLRAWDLDKFHKDFKDIKKRFR